MLRAYMLQLRQHVSVADHPYPVHFLGIGKVGPARLSPRRCRAKPGAGILPDKIAGLPIVNGGNLYTDQQASLIHGLPRKGAKEVGINGCDFY
jgi:hypothetical protein